MVTCHICNAVTKPSSLEYHERMHKIQVEEKQRTNIVELNNINLGPKIKRKAAEKYHTYINIYYYYIYFYYKLKFIIFINQFIDNKL
jgi:hypothetical protein